MSMMSVAGCPCCTVKSVMLAVGGRLRIVTVWWSELCNPTVSATVKVTLNGPWSGNTWSGFASLLVDPSPKSHDRVANGLSPAVDWSVNDTDAPSSGGFGVKSKAAVGGTPFEQSGAVRLLGGAPNDAIAVNAYRTFT